MKYRFQIKCLMTAVVNVVSKRVAMIQRKLVMLICMATCLTLSACSSPENDGIKAAEMEYSYNKDYFTKLDNIKKEHDEACKSFIDNFNSFSFTTRLSAYQKFDEYVAKSTEAALKLEDDKREWDKKTSEYYQKMRSKYKTNKEKAEKFDYAYGKTDNGKFLGTGNTDLSEIYLKIEAIEPGQSLRYISNRGAIPILIAD